MFIIYLDIMPPKKKARRDDVTTRGPPPSPTDVQMGKKGPKEPGNSQRLTLSM